MKYLIPQERLKDLMTSFLTDSLSGGVNHIDNFIIVYYNDDGDDYYNSELLMEFDSEDGRLYIDKSFIDTFDKLFPFGKSQLFIEEWFENYFGVEVEYVES
jgi:hypothetical protein